jgi:hypothetical protein
MCLSLFLVQARFPAHTVASALAGTPEIRSINPDRGTATQEVIIKGRNFSPVPSDNLVKFGDKMAVVRKAKKKKLTVLVPEDLATTVSVTVTVAGQTSNAVTFIFIPPVTPLNGVFEGKTSQNVSFRFGVLVNRETVSQLRTSFICASGGCTGTVPVEIDRFGDITNGHFEIEISTPTFQAEIKGVFLNEETAEGTAEFTFFGACTCQSNKLTWSARRN